MANVTDPNLWRAVSLPDPQRQMQASTPHAVPPAQSLDASCLPIREHGADEEWDTVELSTALRNLFDSGRDQVIWNLSPSTNLGGPEGEPAEQYVRIDPRHGYGPAIARSIDAAKFDGADASRSKSWLIIVDDADDVLASQRVDELQGAVKQLLQILLVVCETDKQAGEPEIATTDGVARRTLELSSRLSLEYVGPVAAQDSRTLLAALAKIKEQGRPTLLHVQAPALRPSAPRPHAAGPWPAAEEIVAPASELLRSIASCELARMARDDARIVAVSTDLDASVLDPWKSIAERMFPVDSGVSHALEWCASLAAGGSTPFAFLAWEELQNSFGEVRQSICMKRAAVTLIVEPRAERHAHEGVSSAGLAGIRQLPHTSVLSPKDAAELQQMLQWCATRQEPAVIWLPQTVAPQVAWPETTPIEHARAEQLREGSDVAIIAWGPMVAAAQVAAECLAQQGISAGIVNVRFVQPLDAETIARAVRDAVCVVVVDDAKAQGGFAGWVLERLLHLGITQCVSIVTPDEGLPRQDPHDAHKQCALRIVECCRWLAEEVQSESRLRIDGAARIATASQVAQGGWFAPLGVVTLDVHDEQRQVLAQQFSPFIDHWVGEYSRVGARDVYLWRWCLHGLGLTTLSCVAPALRLDLCETKLLAVMYGVMLDDIADHGGEEAFLVELTKIISGTEPRDFSRFTPTQQDYARFTCDLWESFECRLKNAPCYAQYEELLAYDHRQILNTMSYSYMVNRHPALLNLQEHDMYLPHNMQMMSFATMDLMCSPEFNPNELGRLREVIWHAQSMGRIGNLVSTWQREIADRDFTSGVFARALAQGDVTLDDLRRASPSAIEAAIRRGGHEVYFLQRWEAHRKSIQSIASAIRSVDVGALLLGLERLIHMELCSRGFK